jgi:hypothetical protein
MRWALRLVLQHDTSADKVKKIINTRFREFASDHRSHNTEQTPGENLEFAMQVGSEPRVPLDNPVPAPDDVIPLLPPHSRPLAVQMKHINIQGRQYSTRNSTAIGNSQVMYVPKEGLLPMPGSVKYILYIDGTHYLAVNRIRRLPDHRWNFFRAYLDYPATIAESVLGVLDFIPAQSTHICGHYAKLILSEKHDLLIDLSRVSASTLTCQSHSQKDIVLDRGQ